MKQSCKLSCWLQGFLVLFGLIGLAVIICCIIVFCKTIVHGTPRITLDTPKTDTLIVPVCKIDADTIIPKSNVAKIFENNASLQLVVDSLRREVEVLRKYDSELILNIRQETNNSLEKINGWIAFWIATSCLVCMIVPLILQLVNWQHHKDQIESIKLQIEREQEKLRMLQFYTHLQVGINAKWIRPWEQNNGFAHTMWKDCFIGIEKITNDILDNTETINDKEKLDLIRLLLQMLGYLKELQRTAVHHRVRDMETLNDEINKLFRDLMGDGVFKSEDIKGRFDKIFKQAIPLLGKIRDVNN